MQLANGVRNLEPHWSFFLGIARKRLYFREKLAIENFTAQLVQRTNSGDCLRIRLSVADELRNEARREGDHHRRNLNAPQTVGVWDERTN